MILVRETKRSVNDCRESSSTAVVFGHFGGKGIGRCKQRFTSGEKSFDNLKVFLLEFERAKRELEQEKETKRKNLLLDGHFLLESRKRQARTSWK